MTYTAGTQGASATPALAFMNTLDPLLVAAGFTFVETVVPSGTVTARVYKSPAAGNGVGDFYLVMRRTSDAATNVNFHIAEDWDTATKRLKKYIPNQGNVPNVAPNAAAGYTVNDATGIVVDAQLTSPVSLNTTGFSYWVSANAQRVIVATRVGTQDTAMYAGLFDETLPGTVAGTGFPLICTIMGTTTAGAQGSPNTAGGGFTREPAATTAVSANFGASVNAAGLWGFSTTNVDSLYTGLGYASRAAVLTQRVNGQNSPRGLLKDVLYYGAAPSAVNGDTITTGGKTYTRMGQGTGNGMWWTDQAA